MCDLVCVSVCVRVCLCVWPCVCTSSLCSFQFAPSKSIQDAVKYQHRSRENGENQFKAKWTAEELFARMCECNMLSLSGNHLPLPQTLPTHSLSPPPFPHPTFRNPCTISWKRNIPLNPGVSFNSTRFHETSQSSRVENNASTVYKTKKSVICIAYVQHITLLHGSASCSRVCCQFAY